METLEQHKRRVMKMFGLNVNSVVNNGGGDADVWVSNDGYNIIKLCRMNFGMIARHRIMMMGGHPVARILDMRVLGCIEEPDQTLGRKLKQHWDDGPEIAVLIVQERILDAGEDMPPTEWLHEGVLWWQSDNHSGNFIGSVWVDSARIRCRCPDLDDRLKNRTVL